MASSALEFDDHYAIIGTGSIDNDNHITITRINKIGEYIDTRNIPVNNTIESEILYQQALSCYNQQKVMGVTVVNESASLIKARRLFLNNDLTVVTDSSWQYISPEGEEAMMFVTHRTQANTIIHGLNYYTGSTINSTLLSTDTLGNVIWESNFSCGGNSCWMIPHHIHPAHDGGYIFTHTEERNSNNGPSVDDHDVVNIIKTDSLGVEQWRMYPGGEGDPYSSEHILLQPTDDGNYLCVWADNRWETPGTPHFQVNPDATMWFAKIAPDGNKIWEKTIQDQIDMWDVDAGYYTLEQMIRTPDDNFLIIGTSKLFKINQEGNIIWARRINPFGYESSPEQKFYFYLKGINMTSDGGMLITGELEIDPGDIYPEYIQTGFALKLDEYGCLEADCQEDDPIVSVISPQLSIKEMSIYPNPARESVMLSYDVGQSAGRVSFTVADVAGRVVHEQVLTSIAGSVQVDTQGWASGVYLCRLVVDGAVGGVRRMVITH